MSPIRTVLIGLSANAATSWASSAHIPYLLSAHGRSRYTIIGLLNSSKESTLAAIKNFNLPAETRAYASPEEVAADPVIQLVVCCTRVDKHFETVFPSVKAGKDVFVEWPLAENAGLARELADAAKHAGGRTMIGLQGRVGPLTRELKRVIEDGRIGKILGSAVRLSGPLPERDVLPSSLEYFLHRSIGGNMLTITAAGHGFDLFQTVLGEAVDVTSHLQLQRPVNRLRDVSTGAITGTSKSDVPDLMILTARLTESPSVVHDASFLFHFRRDTQFPGEPNLVWTITGERGEIRVTNEATSWLHMGPAGITVDLHDFETGRVERVGWNAESWPEDPDTPGAAKNIGLLYERFATGGEYPTWEDAVRRHEQIDGLLAGWVAEA